MGMQAIIDRIAEIIRSSYADEVHRKTMVFNILNILLSVVSLTMTVVNWRTEEYDLMIVTGVFTLACLANFLVVMCNRTKAEKLFTVSVIEVLILLTYFMVSGVPQGFSAMWTLLVPSFSMFIYGKKTGIRMTVLMFLMVTFFFWTPLGRDLVMYEYHETFALRFPFVYICLFALSYYIETIRLGTYDQMRELQENAVYLYRHDALTGLYTRYAFNEELQHLFQVPSQDQVAVVVFDVDDFKNINDRFGHNVGDTTLQTVAGIVRDNICEHCMACRWGGEEFLVLMRCEHDPFQIAERVRTIVNDKVFTYEDRGELRVTLSVGVAVAETLSEDRLSDFINCADRAMYESKAKGKNQTTLVRFPKEP